MLIVVCLSANYGQAPIYRGSAGAYFAIILLGAYLGRFLIDSMS